jgi:hypothetical protein
MKRIVLMALLALALPIAAFAGSSTIDFTNESGTLTGSSSGLALTGSTLAIANPWGGSQVISTTGSGMGAVSSFNGGGLFTITGNGADGFATGTVFTGSFTGLVTLTNEGMNPAGGTTYDLVGHLTGSLNGGPATGFTFQDFVFSGAGGWMGSSTLGSGDTLITPVPEPGTLGLLGTGLVGLAGVVRKKLKA